MIQSYLNCLSWEIIITGFLSSAYFHHQKKKKKEKKVLTNCKYVWNWRENTKKDSTLKE